MALYGLECPCRECEERFFGCFAECDIYKAWKTEYEARRKKAREKMEKESETTRYVVDAARRSKRNYRRKKS